MILGQAEESWLEQGVWATAQGLVGGTATAAIHGLTAIKNAITGGGEGEAEGSASPAEVGEGVVSAGKATARKPEASLSEDSGYAAPSQGGASVWPWLLGVGLLAGGYWLYTRRKRSKR